MTKVKLVVDEVVQGSIKTYTDLSELKEDVANLLDERVEEIFIKKRATTESGYEREEIQKQIMESEWKPIDTIAVLDALLKEIVTSDKNRDICYPIALVNAIKSLMPLVDEDYKKENEGLMRVLITDREQLLRLYRNRQGTSS